MMLYYKPGACSMAAHILLNEAGADYQLDKVDTAAGRTERGGDFRAVNPRGYVPALKTADGAILTENAAILPFLEDTLAASAFAPAGDPLAQARRAEALSFLSSELHKAFAPFFSGRALSEAERSSALAGLERRLGDLEAMLGDRAYLLGGAFSAADAYAFVLLSWTRVPGVALDAWPRLQAFFERVSQREAVQRALREEGLAQ